MSICQIYDLCADTLWLGRYGENGARDIAIDVGKWFADLGAEGTVVLVNWRPGEDDQPYNPNVTMDGSKVVWSPSNIDLAISGRGFAELRYYVGNALAKSKTFRTVIDRTPSEGAEPPSAAEDWLERMEDAAVTAQTASETAVTAAETATEGAQAVAQALPTVTQAAQTATSAATTATNAATEAALSEEVASTAANAAQAASETATAASQTAVSASGTATTKAAQAVEAASTATTKASEAAQAATTATANAQTSTVKAGEATTAAATATSKATEATTAASTASAAATTASGAASTATTAAATATSAKTDAVAANTAAQSAKTAAQTAQTGAETAAASVQSSAAQIATNAEDISQLKSDLGNEITEITVNKGALVANEYVKFETGEFLSYGGWSRTDYLPCGAYTEIKTNDSLRYSAFYDSNKQYISQANFQADTFLSVPQNAEYFATSGSSNAMASLVITAKNKGMGYILNEKIENVEDITTTEKTESASSLIDGYLISDTGELASSDWVCTDYIDMPFDEKSGYAIRGTFYGIGGCAIYDKDNNMLLAINGNNVASYGGTTGLKLQTIYIDGVSGAKKIRISGYKTKTASASDLWIKGNTFNGVYEHLYDAEKDITEIKANISTTIASSKVLVIGDSISSDAYASYPKWVTVLKNQGFLPSDTTNSSQHATGFVARYDNQPNDFITRLKAIQNPSQYDLVVVFGGINDYIQNVPMGSETGTDYTVSFKPAVNEFFNYLIQNFTQARLCVLLPLRTYATWKNSVDEYQQAYGDYIKQVAKSYCLPILNLTEDSGFCPYISTFSDMWTLLPEGFQSHDGVHPNEEYERRFLAPMIKGFLQGLM